MMQYKGYYIDHVYFHSKADIDACIRQQAIESYQRLIRYFERHSTLAVNAKLIEEADRLHKVFGLSYEEIEQLEIAACA